MSIINCSLNLAPYIINYQVDFQYEGFLVTMSRLLSHYKDIACGSMVIRQRDAVVSLHCPEE